MDVVLFYHFIGTLTDRRVYFLPWISIAKFHQVIESLKGTQENQVAPYSFMDRLLMLSFHFVITLSLDPREALDLQNIKFWSFKLTMEQFFGHTFCQGFE